MTSLYNRMNTIQYNTLYLQYNTISTTIPYNTKGIKKTTNPIHFSSPCHHVYRQQQQSMRPKWTPTIQYNQREIDRQRERERKTNREGVRWRDGEIY